MDTTGGSTGGNLRICFGCMRPLSGGERICPVCGYDMAFVQSAMFLRPGTYLARRYLLGKALGYDRYFVTYLALDLVSNQRVEVKEYFPSEFAARLSEGRVNVYAGAAGEAFQAGLRRFWEEESSPKRSELVGVVKLLDLFQANQTAYAVFEWVEGRSLHQYLEINRMLPVSEATDILRQILVSLCSLYKAGFTYREILPENVLLSEEGEVILRDFSSVPSQFWTSPAEDPLWNVGFAPPEFYSVDYKWREQSDIYVLGALFYEMVTGHPPLDARTRQRGGALSLPSKLGISIKASEENVLERSLALSLEERFVGAEELLKALGKTQKKIPFKGKADSNKKEGNQEKQKNWLFILGPVALVAIGAFLLFGFLSGNRREHQQIVSQTSSKAGDYEALSKEASEGDSTEDLSEDESMASSVKEEEDSLDNAEDAESVEEDSLDEKDEESVEESSVDVEDIEEKKEEPLEQSVGDERIARAKDAYLLPDSDIKLYTENELSSMSKEVLAYALCEIYSRRGQVFASEEVATWFESFTWYHARTENETDVTKYFSEEEKSNLSLLETLLEKQGETIGNNSGDSSLKSVIAVISNLSESSGKESIYSVLLDYMEKAGYLEAEQETTVDSSKDPMEIKEVAVSVTQSSESTASYQPAYQEPVSYSDNAVSDAGTSYYNESVDYTPQYYAQGTPSTYESIYDLEAEGLDYDDYDMVLEGEQY